MNRPTLPTATVVHLSSPRGARTRVTLLDDGHTVVLMGRLSRREAIQNAVYVRSREQGATIVEAERDAGLLK